jgi:hypothetical protein
MTGLSDLPAALVGGLSYQDRCFAQYQVFRIHAWGELALPSPVLWFLGFEGLCLLENF